MSAIQHFSMSALADLMIEEESEEYFLDDDHPDKDSVTGAGTGAGGKGATAIATDKSTASSSSQYSADYEEEDFEQESVCASPPPPQPEGDPPTEENDTYNGIHIPVTQNLEENHSNNDVKDINNSLLTGSSGSSNVLNYSDSQNGTSSRTIHAMPLNKFTMSPIGQSSQPTTRTVNYNDFNGIRGASASTAGGVYQSNDRENSFDHGDSHSIIQSSPLQENRENTNLNKFKVSDAQRSNRPSVTTHNPRIDAFPPTARSVQSKVAYGRQNKGYSVVTKLNSADVTNVRSKLSKSGCRTTLATGRDPSSPSQGGHSLNPEDIALMREVRKVLNKIEQHEAVSDQLQKAMSRQAVAVQGLKLGSASAAKNRNTFGLHKDALRHQSATPDGLDIDQDTSIVSKESFYDDDDTRVPQRNSFSSVSSVKVDSGPDIESIVEPEPNVMLVQNENDVHIPSNKKWAHSTPVIKKRIDVHKDGSHIAKQDKFQIGVQRTDVEAHSSAGASKLPVSDEKYASLSNLAEETYATFLSDIIEIAKTRGSSSNITSTEELAMHRSLSEFLFQTFAKPNTVKIVRENMIDAALAVSKKTD